MAAGCVLARALMKILGKILNSGRRLPELVKAYGLRTGTRLFWQTSVARHHLIWMTPPGSHNRFYLRRFTTDLPEYDFVFGGRDLDVPLDTPPRVIVDCGAHIGCTTVYFANRFPGATIYALEPEESNFELLKRNVAPYRN